MPPSAHAHALAPATPAASPSGDAVEGVLDREVIQDVIRTVLPDIKDCYEQALATRPDLSGRVVVEMKIKTRDGKGRVDEAEIIPSAGDDLDSPATEHCLLQVMTRVEFPPPGGDGEVIVRYPFVLKTGEE